MSFHTLGHSTRSWEEFAELLRAYEIDLLADVRARPGSRRHPQFNREHLEVELSKLGVGYRHFPALGGFRKPQPDSVNLGWRNSSFRGYADYMQTAEFDVALGELIEAATGKAAAIMCAEAVPWRCHRSLIADALLARGIPSTEIIDRSEARPHELTSFARVEEGRVWYPAVSPGAGS